MVLHSSTACNLLFLFYSDTLSAVVLQAQSAAAKLYANLKMPIHHSTHTSSKIRTCSPSFQGMEYIHKIL